jgi:hypothetical protein
MEDNIKMDLRETRLVDVDLIRIAEDRARWLVLVNTAMNLLVP